MTADNAPRRSLWLDDLKSLSGQFASIVARPVLATVLSKLVHIDRTLPASPDVAKTDVALNAVADEGSIESKLIAGLGVEADAGAELGGYAAGKLQPRRLFDQRHRVDAKRRRCPGIPIAPEIGAGIRLPHLAVVADDGPYPTQAHPSGRTRGRAEPNRAQPSLAWLNETCCQMICACGSNIKRGPSGSGIG